MTATLHGVLEDTVRAHPEKVAVVDGDRTLTYEELLRDVGRLAATLVECGVLPGDRVGLYLDKSAEAVTAVHAVLRAGACYVPVDPQSPASRAAYILRNCGVTVCVTDGKRYDKWTAVEAEGVAVEHLLVVDRPTAAIGSPRDLDADVVGRDRWSDRHEEAVELTGEDLAYILYTSGSTGDPKGVMLSHENGLAFVRWAVDVVGVTQGDRVSSHAPFHFDLSIFDIFAPALTGAALLLVPHATAMFPIELARWTDEVGITVWYSVPTVLTMLVERGGLEKPALPSVRVFIFAGEVFPTPYLRRLMDVAPRAVFWNWYGPTETNVCTGYRVDAPPDPDGPDIPIGSPIAGSTGLVIDDEGVVVERGATGELVIAGPTVMQGYWADEAKTASRMIDIEGQRCYRTGDLVVEDSPGLYRYVGRRDHQVKSRGYRIELGEIETALFSHPDVVEAAVVALPDPVVTNRIVAMVAVRGDGDERALARYCAGRVPRYMVPERFVLVSALPRTSTDKIDRQRIRAMFGEGQESPITS